MASKLCRYFQYNNICIVYFCIVLYLLILLYYFTKTLKIAQFLKLFLIDLKLTFFFLFSIVFVESNSDKRGKCYRTWRTIKIIIIIISSLFILMNIFVI